MEAYASFHFARLALGALVGVAIALIVALTVAQWRSRRWIARSEQQLAAFRDHIPAACT
jgi:two-component system, sensor histidine kinase and response regulator